MQNKAGIWVVAALVAGLIGGYFLGNVHNSPSTVSSQLSMSQKQQDLSNAMRTLWDDHVAYTRLYIVEAVSGNPGTSATAARLLQNQVDIGNAIKPYYGDDAGNQLTALLKTHIQDAVDILSAAKAGNQAKLATAKAAWYDNANQISTFLNQANPNNWPLATLQAHMKDHLDLTLDEAVMELQGNYEASIADYDKVHMHILDLADILTQGLIAQFPNKF
ncbi:MAG: hypothetical protein KGH79_02995 [Patescibacteria group bacterium]|nr:hypothetical protein [Patescibacteria group bacterium]